MRKNTPQKILDTASQILHQEGPEAVNARAIGRRLKIAPSNIFYYFDTELALRRGIVLHAVTENDLRVQALIEKRKCSTHLQRLWAHLEGNLIWGRERPDQGAAILYGLSMMEADAEFGHVIKSVLVKGEEKITALVAMAIADGECKIKIKASFAGLQLHRYLMGLMIGHLFNSKLTLDEEMALIRGYFASFVEKGSSKKS